MMELKVNGELQKIDDPQDTPLLWVLREQLGLTGTKYSCGIGECGSCMVHVDGQAVRSCVTSIGDVVGMEITTIEGLGGPVGNAVKKAWKKVDVPQCGYCQPGQIMTASALLNEIPNPDDSDVDGAMSGVLCRCGTYLEIREAVHLAASEVDHEND